jgi:hypothetical protein
MSPESYIQIASPVARSPRVKTMEDSYELHLKAKEYPSVQESVDAVHRGPDPAVPGRIGFRLFLYPTTIGL